MTTSLAGARARALLVALAVVAAALTPVAATASRAAGPTPSLRAVAIPCTGQCCIRTQTCT